LELHGSHSGVRAHIAELGTAYLRVRPGFGWGGHRGKAMCNSAEEASERLNCLAVCVSTEAWPLEGVKAKVGCNICLPAGKSNEYEFPYTKMLAFFKAQIRSRDCNSVHFHMLLFASMIY